jgi:diguanylate cyclase (GGDEF)-like protein
VTSNSRTWKYATLCGLVLIAVYFVLPNATCQNYEYAFLGTASVVFILIGVHRNQPANKLGWYFVAAAGALFTLGDDVYDIYSILHLAVPFPSYADALYLPGYPFLFLGVISLTRGAGSTSIREDTADAAIVAMGALALSWHFLMNSYVHNSSLTTFGLLVYMAYPIMDIALVFVVFRTLLFRKSQSPSHRLIAAAMSVLFIGDFTYDLLVLHNSYTTGNAVDGLYLLEYVLIAAAALHPSSADPRYEAELQSVDSEHPVTFDRIRMSILLFSGSIAPLILIIASAFSVSVNVVALGTISILVWAIIMLRLSWLVGRMRVQSVRLAENLQELEAASLIREELEAHLRHQALHDPLTGLANRALFEDRLLQANERLVRSGGMDAVLLLDLDDFKGVNDTFGHLIGDQLLVGIARRLETVTRASDTLCRLGGDEFLYLAEGLKSASEAEDVANRLLAALVNPFTVESVRLEQRVSIGLTICTASKSGDRDFVQEADVALYVAKRESKGRYVVFTPSMQEHAIGRFTLVQDLRDALRAGEITMHYQPIVDLTSTGIVGFEALMRWHDAERGWVSPSLFIPLAEQSDLIIALGTFALRESIIAAMSWAPVGANANLPFVSVNFSAHQFHAPDIVSIVRDALHEGGLAPERLVIEMTESAALLDIGQTLEIVHGLNDLGVGIAIDDFGTGFSSLSYLVLLHPKIIKIDRSFVSPPHESARNETLLGEIVKLGRGLNMTVLAEGIETREQLARLRQLGCELGQGFLFSAAVPNDQIAELSRGPLGLAHSATSPR